MSISLFRVFRSVSLVIFFLIGSLFCHVEGVFSQTSFFEGKTITIIQGRRPGGLGDMRTRATVTMLKKHIPGKPTFVMQYMPGGGGRKMANHLYHAARKDGLTIGNGGSGTVASAILGAAGVRYDVDKVSFLGSGNSNTSYVLITRSAAGFDSLEKLRAASGVRIGTLSVGHEIYILGRLFAWIMDLKQPRFVSGYSGPELSLAVTRGEVDGRVNTTGTILRRSPHWIKKKQANFHAVLEIPKGFRFSPHPIFNKPPNLESFTKTKLERKILGMQRTFRLIGSPYLLPPGVPKQTADILRQSIRNMYKDPQFPKLWRKFTGEEAYPLTPEQQTKAVKSIPRDQETLAVYKTIAGPAPLPAR